MPSPTKKTQANVTRLKAGNVIRLKAGGDRLSGSTALENLRGVAYSGSPIKNFRGSPHPVVIDLASTIVDENVQLFYDHEPEPVGKIFFVSNTGQEVVIEAAKLFSDVDPIAKKIGEKAAAGVEWQFSVGLYDATQDEVDDAQVELNGRTLDGPLTVLRGGVIREISILPLGADRHTTSQFFGANQAEEPSAQDSNLAELEEQLRQVQQENAALKKELLDLKLSERSKNVRELFSQVGIEYSDAAAKPYLEMGAELFRSISQDMIRASGFKKDANLFTEVAVADANPEPSAAVKLTVAGAYSNYMKSQSGASL